MIHRQLGPVRWVSFLIFGIAMGWFSYWFFAERPYLHIDGARLEAQCVTIHSPESGRLQKIIAARSWVKEGDVLFAIGDGKEEEEEHLLKNSVDQLQKRLSSLQNRVDNAMADYIASRTENNLDHAEKMLSLFREEQSNANECQCLLKTAQTKLEEFFRLCDQRIAKAPLAGLILKSEKLIGENVEMGEEVCSVCDPHHIWVEAIVPEDRIACVSFQQNVEVSFLFDRHQKRKGVVSWISPIALPNGKGVPIRIELENKDDERLRPNLHADVKIKIH